MDFIPVTYTKEEKRQTRNSVITRLGVGAGLTGVAAALILTFGGPLEAFMLALPFSLLGGVTTAILAAQVPEEKASARRRARTEKIRNSLNEHYGIRLNGDQFKELEYPSIDPGRGFGTFGSVKIQEQIDGVEFVERTVYLTAADGELKLSESRDGKRFKELKPVRHTLEASTAAPLSISA